ncbi:MAG: hypothetical protein CMM01_24660 [Rhodopirellula sp.]|nr:hypothetical protein [Rhodopirellula sp.]
MSWLSLSRDPQKLVLIVVSQKFSGMPFFGFAMALWHTRIAILLGVKDTFSSACCYYGMQMRHCGIEMGGVPIIEVDS